ncbi:MTAP family purine nucleoside phosphorylase [Candidatus Falkowbacteria bacterium]|nr:MTAP family purine nucleoside phosphorylase [Candidatus Falkowbacteria bacterium]
MDEQRAMLGVIAGSIKIIIGAGNDAKSEFVRTEKTNLTTPFGSPSEPFIETKLRTGETVVLLNRHGEGHLLGPSAINYRANVWGMKKLGVTHLLSICAVGSLEPHIKPGKTLLIPDQLFDWTKGARKHTFFDGQDDVVAHYGFADPICADFSATVAAACGTLIDEFNIAHEKSTPLVIIEGPTFSTRAESRFFRETLHAVAVGMTALPEARLAREAGLCYAVLCLPTDYDSWRAAEKGVESIEIAKTIKTFAKVPIAIIPYLARKLRDESCSCRVSFASAVASDLSKIDLKKMREYEIFER